MACPGWLLRRMAWREDCNMAPVYLMSPRDRMFRTSLFSQPTLTLPCPPPPHARVLSPFCGENRDPQCCEGFYQVTSLLLPGRIAPKPVQWNQRHFLTTLLRARPCAGYLGHKQPEPHPWRKHLTNKDKTIFLPPSPAHHDVVPRAWQEL